MATASSVLAPNRPLPWRGPGLAAGFADTAGLPIERRGDDPRTGENQAAQVTAARIDGIQGDRRTCIDHASGAAREPEACDQRHPPVRTHSGRIRVGTTHAMPLVFGGHELVGQIPVPLHEFREARHEYLTRYIDGHDTVGAPGYGFGQ